MRQILSQKSIDSLIQQGQHEVLADLKLVTNKYSPSN